MYYIRNGESGGSDFCIIIFLLWFWQYRLKHYQNFIDEVSIGVGGWVRSGDGIDRYTNAGFITSVGRVVGSGLGRDVGGEVEGGDNG